MDRQQAVDRFEFEQDPALYDDIDAVAAVNEHALVADGYGSLPLETQLAKPQLGAQAISYADSRSPGPNPPCTSMRAPMTCSVPS